ncbi:MAG: hypothetical protein AB4426_12910 [Xenococcaceae cyanobacterium]
MRLFLVILGLLLILFVPSIAWAERADVFSSLDSSNTTQTQIYRFIQGIDSRPRPMTDEEIQEELNDRWATTVLRQGNFPPNVAEIVEAIDNANPNLSLASYVVGEGSQIPTTVTPRTNNRDLRYVIAWPNPTAPDAQDENTVFLSAAPGGNSGFHQVIAWDEQKSAFNYYERRGNNGNAVWSWAGDSSYARNPQTIGKGCFDCHLNGTLLMKELEIPWNNWSSSSGLISAGVVPTSVAREALFQNKQNAAEFERIVEAASLRAARLKVDGAFGSDNQTINNIPELLRHLIRNTTVNFQSTQSRSDQPDTITKPLPTEFFANDFALRTVLGISYNPGNLLFNGNNYQEVLEHYDFKLVQQQGDPPFEMKGSTHFAFFVPVPSDIDGKVLQRLLNDEVITPKFAASILMVDFPNPVFSPKRSQLETYAQQVPTGRLEGDKSNIPELFAAKVEEVAAGQPECNPAQLETCTPERQFLYFWNLPDDGWRTEAGNRLQSYFSKVAEQIETPDGVDAYMRLSISRRSQFTQEPLIRNLNEFSLLLPKTSLTLPTPLEMKPDGTVGSQLPASF